jgi:hypothetical protein
MIQQLVAFVGPLTRFDAASLPTRTGFCQWVSTQGELRFDLTVDAQAKEGRGGVPVGAVSLPDVKALEQHVAKLVSEARQTLAARLTGWLAQHALDDSGPVAALGYSGPSHLGAAFRCSPCDGRGHRPCSNCSATGEVACGSCGGTGRSSCIYCHGSGNTNCTSCGGRGNWTETHPVQVRDYTGQTQTEYRTEHKSCYSCSGGKVRCSSCFGSGRQNCGGCAATGRVVCSRCSGSKREVCNGCAGSGQRHVLYEISGQVASTFRVQVASDDAGVREMLQRFDIGALRFHGQVQQHQPRVGPASVERGYRIDALVTELFVTAGGQQHRLIGIGSAGKVDQFAYLVDALLGTDLSALTATRMHTSGFSLSQRALVSSLTTFLSSEANARIARAIAQGDDWGRRVYAELGGAISGAYAQHASVELEASVRRSIRPAFALVTLLSALTPTIAVIVATYRIRFMHDTTALMILFAAIVICIVGGEIAARALLSARFGRHWPLVRALIAGYGIPKQARKRSLLLAIGVPGSLVALIIGLNAMR